MSCCILRAWGARCDEICALQQQQQGQPIDGSTGAFIPGLQSLSVSTPMTVRWHKHSDYTVISHANYLSHNYLVVQDCVYCGGDQWALGLCHTLFVRIRYK